MTGREAKSTIIMRSVINHNNLELLVSTDKHLLDLNVIINFLQQTHWAKEVSSESIIKSTDNSLCFGLYHANEQIGFARVITDFAFSAWIADVFVVNHH